MVSSQLHLCAPSRSRRVVGSFLRLISAVAALAGASAFAQALQVTLEWDDNSDNETGFSVERAGGQSSSFVEIGTVATDVTTFVDTAVELDVPYSYRVRAFNDNGFSAYSNVASHTVFNTPPTITSIADQTVANGQPTPALAFTIGDIHTPAAALEVTATSSNTALVPTDRIVLGGSGADRTISVSPVAGQSGSATITIQVQDASLVGSTSFRVAVQAMPTPVPGPGSEEPPPPPPPPAGQAPVVLEQPESSFAPPGGSVSFVVTATGDPAPTFQWQKDGRPIIGGNGSTLTLTGLTPGDDGTYTVRVANQHGVVFSQPATLTVSSAPIFSLNPRGQTVAIGETITLTAAAIGVPSPALQWRKNGLPIPGANDSTLTVPNADETDSGVYDVTATNAGGSATSVPANVIVTHRGYEGAYFGTTSDGGSWGLYVRNDNSAAFLAYSANPTRALSAEGSVSKDGSFELSASEFVGASASPASTPAGLPTRKTGLALAPSVDGKIIDGMVSGSIVTTGTVSFSGAIDQESNQSVAIAGHYAASALDGSGRTTLAVVGPSGTSLIVLVGPDFVDAASGITYPGGQFAARTSSGAQLLTKTVPSALTVTASYTPSGSSTPIHFAGAASKVPLTSRLVNVSVRSNAGTGERTLITGFKVEGGRAMTLIRGIGPTLSQFGVDGAIDDTVLSLYQGQMLLETNDDWAESFTPLEVLEYATSRTGAFPLEGSSRDSVLLSTLEEGQYTTHLTGKSGQGIGLMEIYDAETTSAGRLINVSARSEIVPGQGALILGFVVSGDSYRQYLVRAVGPTLASLFSVSDALADPQLKLYRGSTLVQENDDWGGTAQLSTAFARTGAFALSDPNSKDAAILVTLQPGIYSAVISGADGQSGVALLELYEMP